MRSPPFEKDKPYRLECMEVWGGNRAVEHAVSVFGIDAWVLSIPHGGAEQGGDIHYISMCGSGRIARFVLADVAGHGNEAAALAATLRTLMKKNVNRVDQTRFARALNHEFASSAQDDRFATAVLATYFAPTSHLIICNAGHPAPWWYKAADAIWQPLVSQMPEKSVRVRNLPLGVIEPTDYHQFAVPLQSGDLVLLYSDSLIEARNLSGDLLGEIGLVRLLNQVGSCPPDRFNRDVVRALTDWSGGRTREDDVTLVLLHHNGVNPPLPSPSSILKSLGKLVGIIDF
jgi:phosphoserine phosphatase RsbU/P